MPEYPAPSVRGRQLARELRRLRDEANLTGEATAARLGWSSAKVSRIETARTLVTIADLRKLLDLYGVADADAERLASLARTARQRGWWQKYAEALPVEYQTYIGLEAEAVSLNCYEPLVVHGLLQTEDYARAVIKTAALLTPPSDIERRVEVRLRRQDRLHPADGAALRFRAVLDEAVLRRQVGGPGVLRDQLRHLVAVARLPNVTLHVLPYSAGAHSATASPFTIIRFPYSGEPEGNPEIVYVELMDSSLYIEGDKEVYRYTLSFDDLVNRALDPEGSGAFIEQIAADL